MYPAQLVLYITFHFMGKGVPAYSISKTALNIFYHAFRLDLKNDSSLSNGIKSTLS